MTHAVHTNCLRRVLQETLLSKTGMLLVGSLLPGRKCLSLLTALGEKQSGPLGHHLHVPITSSSYESKVGVESLKIQTLKLTERVSDIATADTVEWGYYLVVI